jgi:uncharacterized transporter YbjL
MKGVLFGIRLVPLIPLPVAIAMFVFIPSYTTPMVRSGLGIAMLVLALGLIAGGYALSGVAARFLRTHRLGVGLLLAVVSVLFCTFPALWLVLIGPALLIVIQKQ